MKEKKILIQYLGIALGSIIMAFSVTLFIAPNKIVPGGVTGIGNILHHLYGYPIGVVTLIFNIPIFIVGVQSLGKITGLKTLYCNIIYAITIDLTIKYFKPLTDDIFLASIYGGVIMGIGLGIILLFGGSVGGTDLISRVIHKYFPSFKIAWILFGVDFAVVLIGAYFFGSELALFSIITIYVSAKIIDVIQEGANYGKAFFIISDRTEEISKFILSDINRGVTSLKGTGMYTKEGRDVLFCIVRRSQVIIMKRAILSIDPKAFISIADVREVVGRGFDDSIFS